MTKHDDAPAEPPAEVVRGVALFCASIVGAGCAIGGREYSVLILAKRFEEYLMTGETESK